MPRIVKEQPHSASWSVPIEGIQDDLNKALKGELPPCPDATPILDLLSVSLALRDERGAPRQKVRGLAKNGGD